MIQIGDVESSRGNYRSAAQYFTECIELAREHGFSRVLAANLPMLAVVQSWEDKLDSAASAVNEAVDLAKRTCNLLAEMIALCVKGFIQGETGDLTNAEICLQRSVEITRLLGSKIMEGMCLALLGNVVVFQGDLARARAQAQLAIEILEHTDSGMAFYGAMSQVILARATEDPNQCREILARGEEQLSGFSIAHNFLGFYENAIEVSLRIADWDAVDRFAKALEDFSSAEPLPHCTYLVARGRALAVHGRGNRNPEAMAELQGLRDEAVRIGRSSSLKILETALASP